MWSIPGTIESITKYNKGGDSLKEEYWSGREERKIKIRTKFGDKGLKKQEFFWSDGRIVFRQEKNRTPDRTRIFSENKCLLLTQNLKKIHL